MQVIAVDYDNTYDTDPELWELFITTAKARGHIVVIVTFRHRDKHPIEGVTHEVFYTNGQPKAAYMREQGLGVDIWCDDWPELIGATRT